MKTVEGEDFAEKYNLWACVQCGKCTGGCPISMESPLNIRRLIREAILLKTYEKEEIWDCTTCATCRIRCPKGVNSVDTIIGMRSILVEEGKVPNTVRDALESVFKHKNPWGRARQKRTEWISHEDKVKNISKGEKAEMAYFVGCTPAYDVRCQNIAKSLVKLFDIAKVDFGILGDEETCCGNEVKRMGEVGLFEVLMEDNVELFEKYGVEKMVTTSPHCYNVFRNEYDGINAYVLHYTQLLSDLIEKGKISPRKSNKSLTYHDPCFLGKQNGIYEEPRKIIESIPGVNFIEMDRSKERSLCCEGGGGRMWVPLTTKERASETRVKEAAEIGVDIIATACPFCLLTLEDAVKVTGYEGKIEIKDISEVIVGGGE